MSDGVEEIDNVQLMREVGNEGEEITPYGAHCVADELESLRTQLDQERQRRLHAEVLLRGIQAGLTYSEDLKESIDKHFGESDE